MRHLFLVLAECPARRETWQSATIDSKKRANPQSSSGSILTFVPGNSNFVKNRFILIKEIDTQNSKLVLRRMALVIAVKSTRETDDGQVYPLNPGGDSPEREMTVFPRRTV